MDIQIDVGSDIPMFTQLIEQIKQGVLAGELISGDAMPSIRQLANDLGVNQNTIAKAYKLLERDKIIVAKGYKGSFIHPEAKEHCEVDFTEEADDKLGEVVRSLRETGLTDSEIRIAFASVMKQKS